jgi:hypothetical protein
MIALSECERRADADGDIDLPARLRRIKRARRVAEAGAVRRRRVGRQRRAEITYACGA